MGRRWTHWGDARGPAYGAYTQPQAIAPLTDVKARLSTYVEQTQREDPIVITRNGKAVAVLLVPLNDKDLEDLLLARSPRCRTMLDRSLQSITEDKGITDSGVHMEFEHGLDRLEAAMKVAGSTTTTIRSALVTFVCFSALPGCPLAGRSGSRRAAQFRLFCPISAVYRALPGNLHQPCGQRRQYGYLWGP